MLPDNRIRYPASVIDFVDSVGITGQDHDTYPAPTQARYDWMRMTLIGLLSSQSSYTEPTQYREGTPWFDLNSNTLKYRKGNAWVSASDVISLGDSYTLTDFFEEYQSLGLGPQTKFSNTASSTLSTIEIPSNIIAVIDDYTSLVAEVFIDGLMVSPDNISISQGQINLSNTIVPIGSEYVVILRNIATPHIDTSNLSMWQSSRINFKSTGHTDIFKVLSGYRLLVRNIEVVTTSIKSAGAAPTVQFGDTNDRDSIKVAFTTTSNSKNSRHIIDDNINAIDANTTISGSVTVGSTAAVHKGYFIVTGYLMEA